MNLHIPDFSQAKILVVGDIMLDSYWYGGTSRISPEAPVPVVRVNNQQARAGGAANVALNIAALRGQSVLCGVAGDDEGARQIEQSLVEAGAVSDILRSPGIETITKLRVISQQQQLIRLDFESTPLVFDQQLFQQRIEGQLSHCGLLLLSDYAKGTMAGVEKMIAAARQRKIPVFVDPKGSDFEKYRGASLITPNMPEFEAVVGHCASEQEMQRKAEALVQKLELEALLVTRGERGMSLFRKGQVPVHLPTQAREVFDVTGAGDTVIATLATAFAAGASLEDAMALSNIAAGVTVGKLGAATASEAEIRMMLKSGYGHQQGIADEELLLVMVNESRRKGERIVMTNGCFDILHAGHVSYLEQARQLGDRLIVAVNDDDSVKKLKGPSRPVNSLEQRMAVLSGLSAVDWVVPFSEETPERLICRVLPDVLVKGGDYRPEQIAGNRCVRDAGGEVRVLSFVEGVSTSRIIDAIKSH
ncbi:MAG: bifunctional D-glycero-beta-D-manno-heptose-7-phosphate kinase/D-glycero-beta-D-manno-heptose 1-phosphate adenylyltransferase HldE [Gammaproteobacteria bacterium]|nr:bifunctional D-glycero-beta-D-manno-heptose-7-phosphate kinase/D-glycero-beta-D-manno-heptose 1-phosphate adenylyltransferase HldE [Gammaproteobacteria bacterium]